MEASRSQVVAARPPGTFASLARRAIFRGLIPRPARLALFARVGHLSKRLGARRILRMIGMKRLGELLDLVPDRAPTSAELPARFPAGGSKPGTAPLFRRRGVLAAFSASTA